MYTLRTPRKQTQFITPLPLANLHQSVFPIILVFFNWLRIISFSVSPNGGNFDGEYLKWRIC